MPPRMLTLALVSSLVVAAPPAILEVHLEPPDSVLFVDGKKKGSSPVTVKLTAGKHILRVEHKGDAHEEEIIVKAGEKKTWKWAFE